MYQQFGNKCWFTNLTHEQRNTDIPLFRSIKDKDVRYDRFDNYDAINVNKTQDIPCDFEGAMGVPISFLSKYNPDQFEIISANDVRYVGVTEKGHGLIKDKEAAIQGKPVYVRVVIKRKVR